MATTHTGTPGSTSGTRTTTAGGTQGGMGGQTPDTTYDLISVLYHTLQGCQAYEKYAQDAEQAQQQDAAQFFRDAGREFERLAQRGQQLLVQCLQQGQGFGGSRAAQLNSQMSGATGQQSQSGTSSGQQRSSHGNMGSQTSNSSGSGTSRDGGKR